MRDLTFYAFGCELSVVPTGWQEVGHRQPVGELVKLAKGLPRALAYGSEIRPVSSWANFGVLKIRYPAIPVDLAEILNRFL